MYVCPSTAVPILECSGAEAVAPVLVMAFGGFGGSAVLYHYARRTNADKTVQEMLNKQTTLTMSLINYLQV